MTLVLCPYIGPCLVSVLFGIFNRMLLAGIHSIRCVRLTLSRVVVKKMRTIVIEAGVPKQLRMIAGLTSTYLDGKLFCIKKLY